MLYWLYKVGFFLADTFPLKVCYFISELSANAYLAFARRDKRELRENLKVILGEDTDEATIKRHTKDVFRNFAKYLADFFKFPQFTEEDISKNIKLEGREYIDECLAEGKGMILLTLHLGNWELGGAIMGGLGYPISAITLEHKDKRINDFFTQQRGLNGMKPIPVGVQIKECFRVLKRNEVLAIVGDKNYTSGGTRVDFFGKKALMPKGPAAFSLKTGAPIVFTGVIREKDDSFTMRFEKPIRYTPTGNNEEDIRTIMGLYIKHFEKYVREYPDQWYVFRKIWDQGQTIQ